MNIELKLEGRHTNVHEYVMKNISENIVENIFENIFEDSPSPENTQFVQEGNETDDRA